jgi:uncharacterized protein YcfL
MKGTIMKKIALLAVALFALTGCQAQENTLVRLAAHDSFVISEELIDQFVARLRKLGVTQVEDLVAMTESIVFPLPAIPKMAGGAG